MLFDLEINILGKLTQEGLNRISAYFYDVTMEESYSPINSFILDNNTTISKVATSFARLNTSAFGKYSSVPAGEFVSYLRFFQDCTFTTILIKRMAMVPYLLDGSPVFSRYQFYFSRHTSRVKANFDTYMGLYRYTVPPTGYDVIDAYTYASPDGSIDYVKRFIPIENIVKPIILAEGMDFNQKPISNTVYIILVNDVPFKAYIPSADGYGYVSVGQITHVGDIYSFTDVLENGDCVYDDTRDRVFIKQDNTVTDVSHFMSFRRANVSFSFIDETDSVTGERYVVLSTKEMLIENRELGIVPKDDAIIFTIPECPYETTPEITLAPSDANPSDLVPYDSITIKFVNDILVIKNTSQTELIAYISYRVAPVVVIMRNGLQVDEMQVQPIKYDISPTHVGFRNGTLCFGDNDSDLAGLPWRPNEPIKDQDIYGLRLNVNGYPDENPTPPILRTLGTLVACATLKSAKGVPIPNEEVSICIIKDDYDIARWVSTTSTCISGITNIAGNFYATLEQKAIKYGFYIQKEWVGYNGTALNEMYVPYKINVESADELYLYVVLGDDPLLGLLNTDVALPFADQVKKPKEFYNSPSKLSSYQLTGRKIAYVRLEKDVDMYGQPGVKTSFIKPTGIEVYSNRITQIRNAFITNVTTINPVLDTTFVDYGKYDPTVLNLQGYVTSKPKVGWADGWSPTSYVDSNNQAQPIGLNEVAMFNVEIEEGTKITFEDAIPGLSNDNVIGYFLLANGGGEIQLQAFHNNELVDITLESNIVDIDTEKFITKDLTFTLAGENAPTSPDMFPKAGDFGFYTISDYLKSPFGTNACSLICKFSSANPDIRCRKTGVLTAETLPPGYPSNFIGRAYKAWHAYDGTFGVHCIHTPDYDAAQETMLRCPGLDATFVNPFIEYSQYAQQG